MLNNIFRFNSLQKLSIPVVGLLLTLGIVGEQTRPVLSEQIEKVPTSTALVQNYQDNSGTTLLTRLREVRTQRNQRWVASQETRPKTTIVAIANQKSAKETATAPRANFPKQDGVYLYGQSLQPNQLGQGYIVFEKRQDTVKGALYMPSSEFSCFQGTLDKSGELAMTVMGSPDEGGLTQVATSNRLPRINDDEATNYAYSVALQDYHQLKSISANDRRILQMCNQPAEEYRKLVK
ncbi:hypothetical protein [Calothrix sp. PCC 7507]|uniref:hypothetical protein n=1 Tax=Calothrix sp. PCC 7507 TaxID=99598 RepID=UPI00029F4AB7|nr:hypothetical protein [Calothrix sp. PCC 7507]AFY36020.1 hypothetical protein Cal7507_5698 [Calothrix sp. PCC 7507]